jgi:hypothetical protein
MREAMKRHGYGNKESILNEWNYVRGWTKEFVYSLKAVSSEKGAAFTMATMVACQDQPVDKLMYYDARIGTGFNGLFDLYDLSPRPAYYAFLEGILTDTHNFDRSDLMYESPISDPLYLSDSETALDVALESKKSNFLVSDGYGYYYRKYFNHTGDGRFNTSILCRFFQSKLSRDLDHRKWDIIGALTTSRALEVIQGVLDAFTASSKLVAYAVLDEYQVDRQSGSIDLWITMRSKELVDKDINLNITLNYTN